MKTTMNTSYPRSYGSAQAMRYVCAMVMMLFAFGIGNVWGGGTHYVSATTADPAQGLVYLSTSNENNVADSKFKNTQPGGSTLSNSSYYISGNGSGCTPSTEYYWARPSRGYEFRGNWGPRPVPTDGANQGLGYTAHPSSATGGCNTADELNLGPWDGTADGIQSSAGGSSPTYQRPIAYFSPATKYTVTYAVPEGGSYTVHYEYRKSYNTGSTESDGTAIWNFRTETEDYSLTPSTEEAIEVFSYAADVITLAVPNEATNFIGWYEGSTQKSTNKSYTYTAHDNVTVYPMFKELAWGDVTGDVSVNVTAKDTYGPKTVYVNCTKMVGTWANADFTVTPMNTSNEFGSVVINSVTADKANNRVVITYTYTASNWGGIEAAISVTPPTGMGATKQFTIACSAEEVVDYEACIEEDEVRTYTGTLAAMMTQANSMDNKPTVKLMQDMTITAPLSFVQSMTFDVNGKVLTANCASAFSIDAEDVDVKIIDGSFTQVGEIHTSYASASAVSVVTFTQAAKLTMNGGTLSAENTGAGAAYGIDVQQGSIFYMTGGDMTVEASTGNAQGVHVATSSDYATLNGGSINVSAPTNAYGLWTAGQSNITDAVVSVETSIGANAYGAYINGGITTITTTDITANAQTSDAYGAYVNAGRLNFNGGSLDVAAVASAAYGAYIAAGATCNIQQNAVVKAEATGVSGTNVFGINNLGTVSLVNISVTATSPTTAATAVNTATSAVSTTIEDVTCTANAETGTAYGLHHQYGVLNVDGGTFKGIVKTSGTGAYGVRAAVNATIANATMLGEAKSSAGTAYGFVGGVADKTITLTNCDITGKSNTNKAYAIYSRTNVSATGCALTATTLGTDQAYGIYAEDGTNSLTNCNATVTAQTVKAYGAYHKAGTLGISGGTYTVDAKQGAATGAQNSELYGIYNEASKTTTISNATFTVISSNGAYSQNVYGAYINGILNSTGATYTAQAKLNVYGIYGHYSSSPSISSTLNLSNNTITSTATNGTKSYGVYAKKNFTIDGDIVSATATSTDVYAMYFDATSVGEVRGGKFKATGNGTTTYGPLNAAASASNVKLKGGVYDSNTNLSTYKATGYNIYTIDDTEVDYAAGYYYVIATENPSPYVCKIVGGAHYTKLEDALQYTKDNAGTNYTIVMTQNYTLPAGDYELPSNATLLIPHLVGQNAIYADGGGNDNKNKTTTSKDIVEFMRLTLAANAKLSVSGKIEVSAQMWCAETGHISYIKGPYARIYMNSGSLIQLNSGAVLYAWGKITGAGEIKVKGNAEVREMFQIYGMPSMSSLASSYNNNSYKYFPVQQYEINNIEVPTTYYRNARLVCAMSNYYKGASVGVGYNKDDNINVVGTSGALFLVTGSDESSWVRKSYVSSYQVWESNSSAQLGSLLIDMQQASMNSANYILPITTNMKVHILDGNFAITQDAQLLPGSQLEINKTGKLTINSGCKLYVFDADQSAFTSKPDAAVNVHGKIDVKGGFFTSKISGTEATDGANIYSNNADAGTITYSTNAASATSISLITSIGGSALSPVVNTRSVSMESAKLKNGDASYAETAGTQSSEAWVYLDGEWQKTYTNGCFEVIGSTVYAKPSEYVALKKSQTVGGKLTGVEETNHTYLTATDKLLILMDDCQWWEVEATSDPTVFECKKEGYEGFYYYDTSASKWKLKTVTVTFYSAETGDNVLKTITTDWQGVPDQAVIASNPTKATTAAATYTFYGWKSSVSGTEYHWTATLETATADMSYRPVFTTNPRHYTITLVNANNGASVPLEVAYGETPEYTPVKDADAQYTYTFNGWSPEFTTVTGTATYTAQWLSTINRYTVTWKNGDETIETDKNQAYGVTPNYNGDTPSKEADNYYAYTFDGWSLTDGGEKLNSLPSVSGETTYYAHYSTTPRYMVTFANYDGTQLQKEPVTQGVNPVYRGLTPARARDLDGYYKFIGWKNSAGTDYAANATLPAVTAKETYTAQYDYVTELYLITLNNIDGNGGTWSGKFGVGATPFYNPDNNDVPVEPAKAGNAQYYYEFTGWSPALQPVTGTASYTAQFEQHTMAYDITFANVDGNGATRVVAVEYGTVPACPVTPEKSNGCDTYEFLGWNTTPVAVTGVATYTATFSATPTKRQFPITFDLDNGTTPTVVDVECGQTPSWTGATPTKSATAQYTYTFTGWYPTLYPVDGEESYIALYSQTVNKYTVTFKNYDGTVLQSSQVAYGATPSAPANPTRPQADGYAYTFSGWSPSVTSVTGNATYTAQYNATALVASVTTSSDVTTYYSSWADAFNDANTNSTGNCILRIYQNVTATNNTTINKNMTIDLNGHTISCTTSTTSNTRLFYINSAVALSIEDSNGGGKIYYEGTGSTTYNAIYVNNTSGSVTVNGGTIQAHATKNGSNYYASAIMLYATNSKLTLNSGELIGSHGTSNRKAYAVRFRGTSYGYADIKGGKLKVMADNSITASNVAIFYNTNANRTSLKGGYYSKDPSIDAATNYEKVSIANATADAEYNNGFRYKVVPTTYTIGYTLNSGSVASANPTSYTIETATFTLNNPTRDHYTFAGWTGTGLNSATQTVTVAKGTTGNRTYTATWTPVNYTIAYELNGGSVASANPTSYNIETTTFMLNNPTKVGYDFAGWTGSNGSTPQTTVSIAKGSTGNKTYTANWTPRDDTKYTVKHLLQNVADDEYTLFETEEKEGTTATATAATANTYTGFTAQPISQGTIAADGLAVVNVYYNRNKYTVTWLDGDGTTIKTDANVKYGATPSYDGSTPTKSDDEYCTYEFAGEWTPAIVAVTGNQTYTALFDASVAGAGYGLYLDIVDWTKNNDGTAGTLTINANTWAGSGWPYTINGIAYDKAARAEDRTLTIPYSGSADAAFGIVVTKKNGDNYSIHGYTIPHICNSESATLSNTQTSSIVYVSGGKLTVNAETKVGAIYVAPEAELVVISGVTLTVDSLILRTTAWKAASLENSGTVTSGKTYYTRIVSDNSQYYQFALPLASSIKGMHLSDYSKCTYGTSWILKSYRESSRANNGVEDSNWQLLSKPDGDADVTIAPKIGYELSSNSPYYREFYFPVDLASLGDPEVEVSRTNDGAAGTSHAGWNAICSPLLGKFTQNFGEHPEDALKVSFLTEDGNYWQYVPQIIYPAIPFYYQAPQAGILEFSQYMHYQQAPQRAWNASVPTQWLQVSVSDVNGKMLDQTNIYSHPEKFSVAYETGYDVAKQSTEGGRAVIYTELACGKLAFAAIPDSLAETRVPLTVYAGAGSEYVFTLEDNGYTRRLQYVLLHDTETGSITDLMSGSYTAELTQGTTSGRFYIECVFFGDAPAIATGTENTDVMKQEVGQKIIYNEKMFILYRGRVYDMTGRQCELH